MQKEPIHLTHDIYSLLQQVLRHTLLHRFYEMLFQHASSQLLFLPASLRQEPPERLLNVACGSGEWACGYARRSPESSVIAIDSRQSSLRDAQMTAAVQGLDNVIFLERDLFHLPEKEKQYPLVAAQFLSAYLPEDKHHALLSEMVQVCAPGGHILLLEAALPQTTSQICNQWIEAACRILLPTTLPQDGVASLEKDLRSAGCSSVEQITICLDLSAGTTLYQHICEQISSLFAFTSIFLLAHGSLSKEQLLSLHRQVVFEVLAETFQGEWKLFTIVGAKPE